MRLYEKITEGIWRFPADSNAYLLKQDIPIVIDTGNRSNRRILEQYMDKICPRESVMAVIFTHLHFDHIGNFDLFPNAKFYASSAEIADYMRDPMGTILKREIVDMFDAKLLPLHDMHGLSVIETPGHTRGSVCLWYEKARVLFSGDTLMIHGYGRTDLPTSAPERMQESIAKLKGISYRHLCTGHEY